MSTIYGPSDDQESRAILRRAVVLGVALFSTAGVYGPFHNGVTPTHLALAWTITAGAIAIPGTRRIRYLGENIAAARITLTPAEQAVLDEAAPARGRLGRPLPSRTDTAAQPLTATAQHP